MVIKIKAEDHKLTIPLPNGLVFNGVTAKFISNIKDIPLTQNQFNVLFRELRHAKKVLRGKPILELQSSSGESVYIKL